MEDSKMSLDENILDSKENYIHQYLTSIFQINMKIEKNSTRMDDNCDDKIEVECMNIVPADEQSFYLSMSNYQQSMFENLMNQNAEKEIQKIDNRFISEKNSFSKSYKVFDDDNNKIAYLFNCYYRMEFVKDFANLISSNDQQKMKRYVIDQAALILVFPNVNIRYSETNSISPIDDLFDVLTLSIPWPSDHLTYVKKFFVDIIDAIHNAKNSNNNQSQDDDYVSSLADMSEEELNVENIVRQVYQRFCKKFKSSHKLSPTFIDDIKFVKLLVSSPLLAELFIDYNSPSFLRDETASSRVSSNNNSNFNINSSNDYRNSFRDMLLNTLGSFDQYTANDPQNEKFFYESLLGILLSSSSLPSPFSKQKSHNDPLNILLTVFNSPEYEYPFFSSPISKTARELEQTELTIDSYLSKLRSKLTDLFFSLLKSSPKVRTKTLKWIECFLTTFNHRSKLWANEIFSLVGGNTSQVSDGLILNLSAVLLNLCKPFCSISDKNAFSVDSMCGINLKMLKVDPLYLQYAKQKAKSVNDFELYLEILKNEAVLISSYLVQNQNSVQNSSNQASSSSLTSNESGIIIDDYQPNFITRCFFMTHKSLHLGFRVIHERFTALNQENNQLQRRLVSLGLNNVNFGFNEFNFPSRDTLTPQQQEILNKFEHNSTIILSVKAALIESSFANLLLEFYLATAAWINNLAVSENEKEASKAFKRFDDHNSGTSSDHYFNFKPSKCLSLIPEFIIENIIDFMLFLRYFEIKPKILNYKSDFEPFLTMIILFMGSPNRMRNPHLRAKMAEMLEALLPSVQTNIQHLFLESLFTKPYFIEQLFPALLNVFVSIEISEETNNADVVAFEQKFNYRRPMYVVFKYLCSIEAHQKKLIQLAADAEHNIDSVQAPIFLRFINLLINDAVFLLDEGLSLMSKLREIQQERDSGAWAQLPNAARQQNEANLVHLGRLAKFHNFIGRDTIVTLTTITHYVKSFFSHKLMVDRMASMLNYFLFNLVGPNKRNFKVKQMNDYEFNPGELVKNICRIYVNLACNNSISLDTTATLAINADNFVNPKYEEFCLAIGRDDRSYSPDLLIQANDILHNKLSQTALGVDILAIDKAVKDLIRRYKNSEIPVDDIPEDFLDPLMNTLMNDPVILPNSHKVVDRATITRHLLSDHTDPYTRTPLTMDMLIPDHELKKKIEEFVATKLKESNLS